MPAFDFHKALGFSGSSEQCTTVRNRNDNIGGRVQKEFRHRDATDLLNRCKALSRNPRDRQVWIHLLPTVGHRRVGAFQNECGRRHSRCQLNRDTAAKRVSKNHNAISGYVQRIGEVAVRCERILVDSEFGRTAFAGAEPTVVEGKEVDPQVAHERHVLWALSVPDVAIVAMADHHPHA